MNKFDERDRESGGSEPSRSELEARIRELEAETKQLHNKIEQMETDAEADRDALDWYRSCGLPLTEEEARNPGKDSFSLGEVLAECEREFGR
jgi:chromosome segregation ATPase